jgi:hypothetical protein
MRPPAFNRDSQRRSLAKNVLLPNQLVKPARSHPHGQWRISFGRSRLAWFRLAAIEQSVGHCC